MRKKLVRDEMSAPYIVGLTGGIAMGKTNLTNALKNAGAPVADADEISRALTAPGGRALPTIRAAFGDAVFSGPALDRKALAALVFSDREKREALNRIVHPLVLEEIRRQIDAAADKNEPVLFIDAPLLFEAGLDKWCGEIWCAYLPQKEQLRRLRARNPMTVKEALRRIQSQMPARERLRRADKVIRTDGSREKSAAIVLSMYQELLKRLQGERT